MRANRYFHIAVIGATLLFLVLWQTAAAGPPEKPGNSGLPGCLAKVSELEERIEELEAMLKNFAAVQQTGQKTSYYAGDDGDLQMGVQWPVSRFTDNGDGTVTDHLTELIWLKNANCFESLNWESALSSSNNLANGDCGLSDGSVPGDWRLPNVRELYSLIDFDNDYPALPSGHPFIGVISTSYYYGSYWSSTTFSIDAVDAWLVHMGNDTVWIDDKDDNPYFVWPVRGGN